jgi:hypothetical protein
MEQKYQSRITGPQDRNGNKIRNGDLSRTNIESHPLGAFLCCSSISPYHPRRLDHEAKFDAFMQWADLQTTSLVSGDGSSLVSSAPYAIQLVRQINYGPQESIRYFVPASDGFDFAEAIEDDPRSTAVQGPGLR